jgi:hypothetical protein
VSRVNKTSNMPSHECQEITLLRCGKPYVVKFDEEDRELVESRYWRIQLTGKNVQNAYALTPIRKPDGRKSSVAMHSLITGWSMVDHADHNGLNNCRLNLREATLALNNANRRKKPGSSSQYKGVAWNKRSRRWVAFAQSVHLGSFDDEIEAARAYDAAASARYGPFAYLNFPLIQEGDAA